MPTKRNWLIAIIFALQISFEQASHCAFDRVDIGARALGMGSAFVSTATGADAIFWNPAGISFCSENELSLSYMELYDLVTYSGVAFACELLKRPFSFAILSSLDSEQIYREIEVYMGSSYKTPMAIVGVSVRMLYSSASFGNDTIGTGKGSSIDVGFKKTMLNNDISIDISIRNILGYVYYNRLGFGEVRSKTYLEPLGISYLMGVSFKPRHLINYLDGSTLALQLSGNDLHFGIEYLLGDLLYLRTGLRFSNPLSKMVAMGIGIKRSNLKIDYAFVGSNVGTPTSQISVTVNW